MSDLQGRRAIIMGMESVKGFEKIIAKVPLKEMATYSTALSSITGRTLVVQHEILVIRTGSRRYTRKTAERIRSYSNGRITYTDGVITHRKSTLVKLIKKATFFTGGFLQLNSYLLI